MTVAVQPASLGSAPIRMLVWWDVCALTDLLPDCGAPALVAGRQIAVVRWRDGGEVFALSNYDPFSEAFVISRGIVGDRGGCPKIASPIFKQSFDLRTGVCLDDPTVALPIYPVRVRSGRVEVGVPTGSDADSDSGNTGSNDKTP